MSKHAKLATLGISVFRSLGGVVTCFIRNRTTAYPLEIEAVLAFHCNLVQVGHQRGYQSFRSEDVIIARPTIRSAADSRRALTSDASYQAVPMRTLPHGPDQKAWP